jgi:mannan endo-1,4-beta-mannosidase
LHLYSCLKSVEKQKALVGCNFWAYGGSGRPSSPKSVWYPGDDLIGDPPHEFQGWYSVYDIDKSTLDLIQAYSRRIKQSVK